MPGRRGWAVGRPTTTAVKRIVLLAALLGGWSRSPASAQDDLILLEIGKGYFGEEGRDRMGPILLPPEIMIYKSGRMVFWDDEGVWEGRIDEKRFQKLRRKLAKNELLKKSQILLEAHGELLGMHGGMAYIHYLDPKEVIVAAYLWPTRGPWFEIVRLARSYRPSTYHSFIPERVKVEVRQGRSPYGSPVPWPFKSELSLNSIRDKSEKTLTDPRMVDFVLRHLSVGFSVQTITSEDGTDFTLWLQSVPGWYEPVAGLDLQLGSMIQFDEKAGSVKP